MKLVRLVVLTAAVAASQVSPAMAESLLQSGARLAQQAGRQLPPPARPDVRRAATAAQEPAAERGMSRRKKLFFALAGAIGFAAGVYAIDHGVEDNTPSSKGTRKD